MNSITDAHLGVRVTRAACAYTVLLRANQLQTAVHHLPGPPDLIYMYMYMYMYEPLHSTHHRVSFRGGREGGIRGGGGRGAGGGGGH